MPRYFFIGDKSRLSGCDNRDDKGICTLELATKDNHKLHCPGRIDSKCCFAGGQGNFLPTNSFDALFSLKKPKKPKIVEVVDSEFGCGATYCMGLFLKHAERKFDFGNGVDAEVWFNGSSDHLYDLQLPSPKIIGDQLHSRLKEFKDRCLNWGHGFPETKATAKDIEWSLNEACELLRLIDKKVLKVKTDDAIHT